MVRGLKSGDREAFRALVDRYHVRVIRICVGFVHVDADAEDIAQEVFIEVFRSVEKFREESGLMTWIYRIAVNKSLNFMRSRARDRIISFFSGSDAENETRVPETPAGADSCPEEVIYRQDRSQALSRALESLPKKQKTAFIMNKYEDLSYKEVAEIMNISVGSVESLLFRAKQNLQRKLERFYKSDML